MIPRRLIRRIFFGLMMTLISLQGALGHALSLNTSYLSLELPTDWTCEQKSRFWTCFPARNPDLHSAALTVSAKETAPEENLNLLIQQLAQPKVISKKNGAPVTSRQVWQKAIKVGATDAFEALHQDREIEGYNTYYLVSVVDGLTVALSLSVQAQRRAQLTRWIEQIHQTLRFHVPPAAPAQQPKGVTLPSHGPIPSPVTPIESAVQPSSLESGSSLQASHRRFNTLGWAGAGFLVLIAVILLARRGHKRRGK